MRRRRWRRFIGQTTGSSRGTTCSTTFDDWRFRRLVEDDGEHGWTACRPVEGVPKPVTREDLLHESEADPLAAFFRAEERREQLASGHGSDARTCIFDLEHAR